MKSSIVISCYNLGEYLSDLISSIWNVVNRDNVEVILMNDGSTDQVTLDELYRIRTTYPNIQVFNQKNSGLAEARNNGIKRAKGEYIIPLDADNKLNPNFIDSVIKIFKENPEIDIIHGDALFFGEREGLWKGKPFDWNEMVMNNYIDACAAFRKEVWTSLKGYDKGMPFMGFEDWDFWLRAANKGFKFYYLNEISFEYRVRNGSMLDDAWKKREELVSYIFDKPELLLAKELRLAQIEIQELKQEPSLKEIFRWISKKILRKWN